MDKTKIIIALLAISVGLLFSFNLKGDSGRYNVTVHSSGLFMRVDTFTGDAWVRSAENEKWIKL